MMRMTCFSDLSELAGRVRLGCFVRAVSLAAMVGSAGLMTGAIADARAGEAQAQAVWPEITRTEPVRKRLEVRTTFRYREIFFDPPVLVKKVDAPLGFDGAPETLLISHISAMKNLDYDWWLSTFDEPSRKKIEREDAAAGRTRDDRIREWEANMQDASVTMERWLDTGEAVFLTYKARQVGDAAAETDGTNETAAEIPVAIRLYEGRWAATLDYEDHPVLMYFDEASSVVERVIR